VRGYDHGHQGPSAGPFTLTIDGGCGYGGKALAALIDPKGELLNLVEA
jgi:hypothetical protein